MQLGMTPVIDQPYGPAPWQAMDLFLPHGYKGDQIRGVVAYLHGGGFRKGDRKDPIVQQLIPAVLDRGLAFASVGYRLGAGMADLPPERHAPTRAMMRASARAGLSLSPKLYGPTFVAALWDISAALAALGSGAMSPRLAGSPVILLGNSAGGIAALSLAHPPAVWARDLLRPSAVFAVSAAMVQPWCLRAGGPPCRIMTARRDRIIPPQDARLAQAVARTRGADLALIETGIPGHNAQLTALAGGRDPFDRPWLDRLWDLTPA
jgi:hypothetical protein